MFPGRPCGGSCTSAPPSVADTELVEVVRIKAYHPGTPEDGSKVDLSMDPGRDVLTPFVEGGGAWNLGN